MARRPHRITLTATAATNAIRERSRALVGPAFDPHAEEQMEARDITVFEVMRVLREGKVVEKPTIDPEWDEWKAIMELRLPGASEVAVVTLILGGGGLFIKTVMWR